MFVRESFFSFSLLAFTLVLMVLGSVLLIDALRRFSIEIYKATAAKPEEAPPSKLLSQPPEEKDPRFNQAA
jgi:hypothetical protein